MQISKYIVQFSGGVDLATIHQIKREPIQPIKKLVYLTRTQDNSNLSLFINDLNRMFFVINLNITESLGTIIHNNEVRKYRKKRTRKKIIFSYCTNGYKIKRIHFF